MVLALIALVILKSPALSSNHSSVRIILVRRIQEIAHNLRLAHPPHQSCAQIIDVFQQEISALRLTLSHATMISQ
jgi:translation initiation factor 2B subunit (eIF-2B alpha/beta/delta family)